LAHLDLLSPLFLARRGELRRAFAEADPFPHLVLDRFCIDSFLLRLTSEFPDFDPEQARNELGEVGGKAAYPNLAALGPAYAEFDALMQSPEFLAFLSDITGIPDLLYDPDYVGGGAHLNRNGQDLDPHVDFNIHPRTRWHRRLNLILFLNPFWKAEWGGSLEFHLDPRLPPDQNRIRTVEPVANRCVIFETSERSWHGFRRIQLPAAKEDLTRDSIAVYFYTRTRPAEEIAPSHGTFYIPRPLPEHVVAGHTLTAEDVHELQVLLQRRDTQIQHLYDREKEFSRVLNSRTVRAAHWLTAPLRRLRRGGR
jgi:hypothetical protein